MPLEISDFPQEVQEAFFIYSLLSDRWDGMSGTYLGKDWTEISYILKLYDIAEQRVVFWFMKQLEIKTISMRATKAEQQRKSDERKAKAGGGKNYTHNVRG